MRLTISTWSAAVALYAVTAKADEPFRLSPEENAVVELTNKQRAAAKLPALKADPKLTAAARAHSANMARRNKLSHELDGKGPSDRIRDTGYAPGFWGENVAEGQATPADALDTWMHSPPHKANILSPKFTEIGVGVARSDAGTLYWTQVFGSPAEQPIPGKAVPGHPLKTAKFTVANKTDKTVAVNPVGTPDEFALEPGVTGTFTMTFSGVKPTVRFSAGGKDTTIDVEDGRRYELSFDSDKLRVERVDRP